MKKLLFPLLLAGVVTLIFSGCKKEESDTETQSAVDNSICEGEFMRIMPTVNSIAVNESGVKRLGAPSTGTASSTCPLISVDSANIFPGAKLIIDYGTGCVDSVDGKTRRGRIIARFTESWDSVGCQITITLDNFYVNNIHYEGSVRLTRNSLYSFTTDVMNGKCTTTNWEIQWASTRTVTQTAGTATPTNPSDDVFSITGNANGVNRDGVAFDVTVTQDLIKAQNCAHISSGVLELTPSGKATRTVNFGDGTCDNKATLTINGNTFTFTMN